MLSGVAWQNVLLSIERTSSLYYIMCKISHFLLKYIHLAPKKLCSLPKCGNYMVLQGANVMRRWG